MDEGQLAAIRKVRVSVHIIGGAVGGPPGVGNTGPSRGQRACRQIICKDAELARSFVAHQVTARPQNGEASGVISAVFEALQAAHQDVLAGSHAHISHNSTHASESRRWGATASSALAW